MIAFAVHAKRIVELGTGQGAGGAEIMTVLASDAKFTTINYADGHRFGEKLDPWKSDSRLSILDLDTLDPRTLELVHDGVDLLIIDTTHEAWHAAAELRLWQSKLVDGAIVVVDDLDQHDMMDFWETLPYTKACIGYKGVFRYTGAHYCGEFQRPKITTYGGSQ